MLTRIKDNSSIYYAIIAVIVLISWIVIHNLVAHEVILYWDAGQYFRLAQTINAKGIMAAADPLRTYGYPLFLSIILRTNPGADYAQSEGMIVVVQFFFHTLTSFLAVSILKRFITPRRTHPLLALTCFAIVQFNAVLLGLTHDILTDSFTVFLITLFFWISISKFQTKWLLLSTILATATVIRPFHQTWGMAYVGFLIAIYGFRALSQQGWKPLSAIRSITEKINLKTALFRILQIAIPLIFIVGFQYSITYQNEGNFSLVGSAANEFLRLHLQETFYTYKYETYIGSKDRPTGIYYVAADRKTAIDNSNATPLQAVLQQPLSAVAVILAKFVGIFQHYEWSTYRQSTINQPNIIFWWGLIPLTAFIYMLQQIILRFNWRLDAIVFNPAFVILSGASLYVLMYAVATIPEHRFAAPVIPVLSVYAVAVASDRRNWRNLALAICISCAFYFMTYQILLSSQI